MKIEPGQFFVRLFLKPRIVRVLEPRLVYVWKGRFKKDGWQLCGPLSDRVVMWDSGANLRDPELWTPCATLREARAVCRAAKEDHRIRLVRAFKDEQTTGEASYRGYARVKGGPADWSVS